MERRSEGRPMAAVMREALAVYLNKNVPGFEIEKKYGSTGVSGRWKKKEQVDKIAQRN
jgi:hypothetical protein